MSAELSRSDLSRSPLIHWCVVVAAISAIAAGVSIALYQLLPVDGGWYSYAGYALSVGRGGFDHQRSIDFVMSGHGVRAAFPYNTATTLRAIYSAGWFETVGVSLLSIRLLTLLEYLLLLISAWVLYRSFFRVRWVAVLALLLLMTDKSIMFGAGADFRPDLALAAAATCLYVLLRGQPVNPRTVSLVLLVGTITASIHTTSPIPLCYVLTAAFVESAISNATDRSRRLALVGVAGLWCIVVFFYSPGILEYLVGGSVGADKSVDISARIAEQWAGGLGSLANKEIVRWYSHFLVTNLPQLIVFALAGGVSIFVLRNAAFTERLVGPLAGLCAAILFTLLFDPHGTESHILPLLPFLPLVLVVFEESLLKIGRHVLAGAVLASAGGSTLMAFRLAGQAEGAGVSNRSITEALAELTSGPELTLVAGGTEFWPYFPANQNVVILDRSRRPQEFEKVHGLPIRGVDLIVAGTDHLHSGWQGVAAQMAREGRGQLLLFVPQRVLIFRVYKH